MVKVERSFPAPSSLAKEEQKKNGSYEKEDAVEQLKKDFHNKCYICELKYLFLMADAGHVPQSHPTGIERVLFLTFFLNFFPVHISHRISKY